MDIGLKRALRLSGSSVLPAYPGFMVMKEAQVGINRISRPSNTNRDNCRMKMLVNAMYKISQNQGDSTWVV